jgi:undecaprenyl-diphosphatase
MTFSPNPVALTARFQLLSARALAARGELWLEKLIEADLAAVRKLTTVERSAFLRFCAILISKLGNGWIYPILAAVVFAEGGFADGKRLVLLAGVNAASMHVLYPLIKKRFKRRRPFKVDPSLPSLLKTLDEHSFPSGHAMTLTGVLAPIVMFCPGALLSAVAIGCCMAWSRVATGHHYPSDVAAGVALGLGVGYPLAASLAAFF